MAGRRLGALHSDRPFHPFLPVLVATSIPRDAGKRSRCKAELLAYAGCTAMATVSRPLGECALVRRNSVRFEASSDIDLDR